MFRRMLSTRPQFAWKDVPYTPQHHALQTLDIAIPTDKFPREKLPTCVFIHGGAWQRGDKAAPLNNGIEEVFVRGGCIGVSVNYRLSPEVVHPEHSKDVATAIQWLHSNIAMYGGDPERMVLIGHSAGAHLLMNVIADPQYLAPLGVGHSIIKGVVGISGVYNVVRLANARLYGTLTVNPAFGERTDHWREGSITTVLARQGDKSPLYRTPALLLTAQEDFHFGEDATELQAWLREGGNGSVETEVIPDRNHFSIIRDLTANDDDPTLKRIQRFLNEIKFTSTKTAE